MKTKRLFVAAFAALALISCSKEKDSGGQQEEGGSAYMALTFPDFVSSKADTNEPNAGTANESKMTSATVLLFDADNKCLGSVEYTDFTSKPATESKAVPAKTKKIFVVINNYAAGWDFSGAEGQSWDAINTYATVNAANIATADAFMMTNSGDNTKGALADVTVYETADDAKASPAAILVDRVASKVQVASAAPTTTNAVFSFLGWNLNTVNKTTRLYSDRVTYANASTNQVAGVYRRDKNYMKADFPTVTADLTQYLKDNYTWLGNGTSSATMSAVDKLLTDVLYCAENTMEADAQLWGHTTKVVVKGEYTPTQDAMGSALAAKASYFSWNSNVYSVDNMKAEYKKADKANLKTDLIKFLAAADATFAALTEENQKVESNIDAAIGRLDGYSGIKAKYNAVRYFHQSVCYYDALIRHDKNVTVPMALGRYGVVRNNSYLINITAVKGPGTPWIPDPTDPTDPTDPSDPDDEVDANLAIDVTVNPWTYWVHDTELGK